MSRDIAFLVALALAAIVAVESHETFAESSAFDGEGACIALPVVTSPDQHYVVSDASGYEAGVCNHALSLWNRDSGRTLALSSYPGAVSVLWSPESRAIAINNHIGSNVSECAVFSLDTMKMAGPSVAVIDRIGIKQWKGGEVDRSYCRLESWLTADTLLVHVWGEGDGRKWDAKARYSIDGHIVMLPVR